MNSLPSRDRSPFGELLLRLRTARGLTQELLAQATQGDRISSRSITSYEKSARTPQEWVLPHRPALRLLADAMDLDMVDQHMLVVAWNTSRKLRDAKPAVEKNSDFVTAGREGEVQAIMNAWQKALAGIPQVVFLGGIAGIGKTELARHLSDVIADSTQKVMISWGAASSWATDIEPYLSFRSATDRILVKPDASTTLPGNYPSRPELGRDEINRVIESIPLLGGAIISERTLRSMASVHGSDYSDDIDAMLASRESTETIGRQEEYSRLLVHFSKSWPVVIVLEDLHWSGEQTTTLMLYLARQFQNMRDVPILFICTYRNDELQPGDGDEIHPFRRLLDSISHSPQVSMITLNDAISPTAGMAFVRAVTQQTPMSPVHADRLANYLYDQTSGHPLLTGELMRHLLETDSLTRTSDGHLEFDIDNVPEKTPSAISTFIDQRLKRVSRRGQRILEIASVMDDIILSEIIAETMTTEEEEILEIINHELVEMHQLLLPGTPVRYQRRSYASYRFPHALFREQIYNGLPEASRKRMHLAIAEAMERQYSEADTASLSEITSHYMQAEDWHRAQKAGYRLAEHASAKLDWDLARIWFSQAEDLAIQAQDPEQLWRTRAARLAMMRGTGLYTEAVELGERILKLAAGHDWPGTLAITYHYLGEVYYDLGRVDQAAVHLKQAIELHHQQNAMDLAAAGEAMLSHSAYRQGRFDIALTHARTALNLSRKLKNSWIQPEAFLAAANCELDLGFYQKAIESYQIATELATMIGKLQNQFTTSVNIGLAYTLMGEHEQAIEFLEKLGKQLSMSKHGRLNAAVQLYLGFAFEGSGKWDSAAKAFANTSHARRSSISFPTLYDSVAGQLRVAMNLQQDDNVREWLEEITTYLDEYGFEGIEYPLKVMTSVAKAYRYLGDEQGYTKFARQAHSLLMERAGMIQDAVSRDSYLANVPINVEVQSLYDSLGVAAQKR